jgi:hypothetical protein
MRECGVRQSGCRFCGWRMGSNLKSGSRAPALQNVGAVTFSFWEFGVEVAA